MFEKEAEEYATKHIYSGEKYNTFDWWHKRNTFQDGAEFGYNKANEEAKEIINELLMNGYDESTRAKALDFLYPDKE